MTAGERRRGGAEWPFAPSAGGEAARPTTSPVASGGGGTPGRGLAMIRQLHNQPRDKPVLPESLFQVTPLDFESLGSLLGERSSTVVDDLDAASAHAASFYINAEYEQAVGEWTNALLGEHSVARLCYILRHRAAAYLRLGRLDEALKDVDRCVQYQPANFDALVLRGDVLEKRGAEPHAILAAYSSALRRQPTSGRAHSKFALVARRVDGYLVARQVGWPPLQRPLPGADDVGGQPSATEGAPGGCALPLSSYIASSNAAPVRPVFCVSLRPKRGYPELALSCMALESWGAADLLAVLPGAATAASELSGGLPYGGLDGGHSALGSDGSSFGEQSSTATRRSFNATAGLRPPALAAPLAQHGGGSAGSGVRGGAGGGRLLLSKLERLTDTLLTVSVSLHDGGRIELLSNSATRCDTFARALLLEQPPSFRQPADYDVFCYGWLPHDGPASARFCAALLAANERYDAIFHKNKRSGSGQHPFGASDGFAQPFGAGDESAAGRGAGQSVSRSPLALSSDEAKELTRWLAELGLERHAPALAVQGVTMTAPLGLTDDDLIAVGVDEPSERRRITEGHASRVLVRKLTAQLQQAEQKAEGLMLRLADAQAKARSDAEDAQTAAGALREVSAALAKEQAASSQLRRKAVQLDAKAAADDARISELQTRVSRFLDSAGELVESTTDLKDQVRTAFYEHRKQLERRTVRTISHFTGKDPSDPAFALAPNAKLEFALRHGTFSGGASPAPSPARRPPQWGSNRSPAHSLALGQDGDGGPTAEERDSLLPDADALAEGRPQPQLRRPLTTPGNAAAGRESRPRSAVPLARGNRKFGDASSLPRSRLDGERLGTSTFASKQLQAPAGGVGAAKPLVRPGAPPRMSSLMVG